MTPIRIGVVATALSVAFGSGGAVGSTQIPSARRMADGKEWTTANLNVPAAGSYCYDDAELNCRRYGRMYTWDSAQRVCQSLGDGWRLPTDDEWRQMTKRYGGVSADSADKGRAASRHSGAEAHQVSRRCSVATAPMESTHGWRRTGSPGRHQTTIREAPRFTTSAKTGRPFHRQPKGEKAMAISVRCVRE